MSSEVNCTVQYPMTWTEKYLSELKAGDKITSISGANVRILQRVLDGFLVEGEVGASVYFYKAHPETIRVPKEPEKACPGRVYQDEGGDYFIGRENGRLTKSNHLSHVLEDMDYDPLKFKISTVYGLL